MFTKKLINRLKMPTKRILVAEDVLHNQVRIAKHLDEILEDQGDVDVSFVSGGLQAWALYLYGQPVDLLFVDRDMPEGDGVELIKEIRRIEQATKLRTLPIITFSGIDFNNDALMVAGASYKFGKEDVINGAADELIFELLEINVKPKEN